MQSIDVEQPQGGSDAPKGIFECVWVRCKDRLVGAGITLVLCVVAFGGWNLFSYDPLARSLKAMAVDERSAEQYMSKCLSGTDPFRNASNIFIGPQGIPAWAHEPPLVSIVVPTYFSRRYLHPFLYSNYRAQSFCAPDKEGRSECELIVYDNPVPKDAKACEEARKTGTKIGEGDCAYKESNGENGGDGSAFLENAMAIDKTVTYINEDTRFGCKPQSLDGTSAAEKKEYADQGWSPCVDIGEKRNFLARVAHGKILIHFDDDDFYGPDYVKNRVAFLDASLKERGLDYTAPFLSKGLRWLEWDLTPVEPAGGIGTATIDKRMCVLDVRRPDKCEEPNPGNDVEYGRSCGAQPGHDWGFAFVYTRATVIDSSGEFREGCKFKETSFAEEKQVVDCLDRIDKAANRLTANQRSVVSLVAADDNLMKIDAGDGATSTWRPCGPSFDGTRQAYVRRSFGLLEDVDTTLLRRRGVACYILRHHVLAKYTPVSSAGKTPTTLVGNSMLGLPINSTSSLTL